jgi:hypothetical protein
MSMLMRRVDTGRDDVVVKFLEEGVDFRVLVEFISLVENYILVINCVRVSSQSLVHQAEWGGFWNVQVTSKGLSSVISYNNIAGLVLDWPWHLLDAAWHSSTEVLDSTYLLAFLFWSSHCY